MAQQYNFSDWCKLVETHMIELRPILTVENIREYRLFSWYNLYSLGCEPCLAALNFVFESYEQDIDNLLKGDIYGIADRDTVRAT